MIRSRSAVPVRRYESSSGSPSPKRTRRVAVPSPSAVASRSSARAASRRTPSGAVTRTRGGATGSRGGAARSASVGTSLGSTRMPSALEMPYAVAAPSAPSTRRVRTTWSPRFVTVAHSSEGRVCPWRKRVVSECSLTYAGARATSRQATLARRPPRSARRRHRPAAARARARRDHPADRRRRRHRRGHDLPGLRLQGRPGPGGPRARARPRPVHRPAPAGRARPGARCHAAGGRRALPAALRPGVPADDADGHGRTAQGPPAHGGRARAGGA